MFSVWLAGCAHALGLFILWTGDTRFVPLLLIGGYSAILATLIQAARFWRDWYNPLSLVLALGLIRFSLPALLLMIGVAPQVDFPGWHLLDFQAGHVLAVTGLLGVVLGWFLVSAKYPGGLRLRMTSSPGIRVAASMAMAAGFISALLFVASNASLIDAIVGGTFRSARIQEGTGIFFYLAHLLISGSALLTTQRLHKAGRSGWTVLLPVMLATLSLWILGGRGRALTPLICGLLLVWYARRERLGWPRVSLRAIPAFVLLGLPLVTWAAYVGQLYRNGLGVRALMESLSVSGIWNYFRTAVFTDVGHLYAVAGALFVGPGVLHGTTFLYSLLWPISQVLDFSARHPGVLVVEKLGGIGPRSWAVATSVVGDAYLNFGLVGIPVVMGIFGALLKATYVRFRGTRIFLPVYVLWIVFALQTFYGSITAWTYTVTVVGSALLLSGLARMLSSRPGSTRRFEEPRAWREATLPGAGERA